MTNNHSYDVIVIGGGVAGVSAALSAARAGAKTLLVESTYTIGGLATAGLVTFYLPLCDGKGTQLSKGIAEELIKLSVSCGAEEPIPEEWLNCTSASDRKSRYQARYNPNVFSILLEKLLIAEGVKILYGGTLSKVYKKDGRINKISVVTRSQTLVLKAKSYIDCTGDASLCYYAGENTIVSNCGNVLAAWFYELEKGESILKMRGSDDRIYSDKPATNKTFSGLDPFELSAVTAQSHNVILKDFLSRGKVSTTHSLASISTIPQVRITRRLDGINGVKSQDNGKYIEESVGVFGNWKECGKGYELPIGCLYGKKIKNLTTAGRCVSVGDEEAWDIMRVIPVCAVTGEAAGTIAALYQSNDDVQIKEVQNLLVSRGIKLHLKDCYN